MKKRLLALLLVAVMVLSVALTGCGKKETTDNKETSGTQTETTDKKEEVKEEAKEDGSEATEDTSEEPGELTLPLCEEKETLSLWCSWSNNFFNSPNEIRGVQHMEEVTNVHIDWITAGSAEIAEKFTLMLASGDYADIVFDYGYPGGGDAGIADGVFLKLNDYINPTDMPNYSKYMENDIVRRDTTTDSGNVYAIYSLNTNNFAELDEQNPWAGLVVRYDWLQEAGLDLPVTLEDWEVMLTAFRDRGCVAPLMLGSNGMIDGGNTVGTSQDEGYFISAYGILGEFYQKDGQVFYGPLQPEYKEYVEMMADWYAKGLIDPNFMSSTGGVFLDNAMVARGDAGAGRAHYIGTADFIKQMGMTDVESFYLRGVQAPVLNAGDVAQARNTVNYVNEAFTITTACENVDLAIKWLDYQYTREGMITNYYGVEGWSYEMNPETGIAEYTEYVTNNPDGHTALDACLSLVCRNQVVGAFDYTRMYQVQEDRFFEAGETWAKDGTSLRLPDKMTLSAEEGQEFSSTYVDIQTYVQENTVNFISGVKSLDEYDAFVEGLKKMAIERCIEIKQNALDRYYAR